MKRMEAMEERVSGKSPNTNIDKCSSRNIIVFDIRLKSISYSIAYSIDQGLLLK